MTEATNAAAANKTIMRQEAPYPHVLAELVSNWRYRPGWYFTLNDIDRGQGSRGLTLIIDVSTVNSYPPHEPMKVRHFMPVPPAAYDMRSWRRWLLEQCLLVDRHEGCEFARVMTETVHYSPNCACGINDAGDYVWDSLCKGGEDHPYAPHHQPGADPYTIFEVGTDLERRTSYLGEVDS